MTKLIEITEFLADELEIASYQDSSLNGVQIEGAADVRCVTSAVDAGLAVIESAAELNSEFLVVHHGLFWGQSLPIVHSLRDFVKVALQNNITLYTAHLPLDGHERYGNNVLLANALGLKPTVPAGEHGGRIIGRMCENPLKIPVTQITDTMADLAGESYRPLLLPFGPTIPEKILVVTGAAADSVYLAQSLGFDTLVTGEPRQHAYHAAKERHINLLFGGHYATETFGVRATGELLKEKFGMTHHFIDCPTGI